MSYLVLARKWRPQTFAEVVGQAHVTRTLQNAIQAGRVAHAYLFTGARGVGKTSVARILAKSLNCQPGITVSPCNECSNCREITQGHSVDVLEIDGASNRGIDSIRELRETVRYRASKSRYKIYIIDEVHMLTTEAFNALLKTLEEPPEHVLFIFATTEPHKIPSTILSRCQRFDFRRIDTPSLLEHLKTIVTEERVSLSESVLYPIAREADGSMRDAQSLLEQLLAFSGEGLSDEEILDVLGVVDRRSVQQAGAAILEGDTVVCLRTVDDLYRRGIDSRRFCQQLCDFFRSLLWITIGKGRADLSLQLPDSERQFLLERAEGTSAETLHLYLQTLLKGEDEIRRSSMPRLSLEMLLIRLSQLPRLETLDRALDHLDRIEAMIAGSPEHLSMQGMTSNRKEDFTSASQSPDHFEVPAPEALPSYAAAPPMVEAQLPVVEQPASPEGREMSPDGASPEDMIRRWSGFVQWLQGKEPKLGAKLGQSQPRLLTESQVELEVLEVYENLFRDPGTIAALAAAVEDYFGLRLSWQVSTRSSLRAEPSDEGSRPKRSKVNPRRLVMESVAVQQAIEVLGGELIEVRALEEGSRNKRKGQ